MVANGPNRDASSAYEPRIAAGIARRHDRDLVALGPAPQRRAAPIRLTPQKSGVRLGEVYSDTQQGDHVSPRPAVRIHVPQPALRISQEPDLGEASAAKHLDDAPARGEQRRVFEQTDPGARPHRPLDLLDLKAMFHERSASIGDCSVHDHLAIDVLLVECDAVVGAANLVERLLDTLRLSGLSEQPPFRGAPPEPSR
jgi:hypothetical protein